MSRRLFIYIAAILLLPTSSCKKNAGTDPKISVSRPAVTVGATSGYSDTITVKSTVNWTASVSDDATGWLTVDPVKGRPGSTILHLTVTKGGNAGAEMAIITITPDSSTTLEPIEVAVTQASYSLIWQKTLGGSDGDAFTSIAQTIDGGYILTGTTTSQNGEFSEDHGGGDVWVVKTDVNANKLWQRCLGGSVIDQGQSIIATSDGAYVMAGFTESTNGDAVGNHGLMDGLVIKLDANGKTIWKKLLGGDGFDQIDKIINSKDGGYILSGQANSSNGDLSGNLGGTDLWLEKLDHEGNKVWVKNYGGGKDDYYGIVSATPDGGYIVAGSTNSNDGDAIGNHGGFDALILKVDVNGQKQWSKVYGGTGDEASNSIIATPDGGFAIVGTTTSNDGDVKGNHGGSDIWVLKVDANGKKLWQATNGGTDQEEGWGIVSSSDGGFLVNGMTISHDGDITYSHGNYDVWILKLDGQGKLLWQKTFGGPGYDYGYSLIEAIEGGWLSAGCAASNGGDVLGNIGYSDGWLIKVD